MDFTHIGAHQICFWKRSFLPWENKWETDAPKFSWDDFHLIPQKRPQVDIPRPAFSIVQIPTTSERYDITEYIPGGLTHESVSGSWSFVVDHTQWGDGQSWTKSQKFFEKYFDGEPFYVELTDDPGTLYYGRMWISEHESNGWNSSIKIDYDFMTGPFEMPDDFFYRIRFLDFGGRELQSDLLKAGDTPIYYKTLPGDMTHKFDHWEPAIKPVSGVQDYTASVEIIPSYHPMVFYDHNGKEITERSCVPLNVDFVLFNAKPIIETLGIYNILLEDLWKVPDNMTMIATGSQAESMPFKIRIVTEPIKKSYTVGEDIDYTGMTVMACKQNDDPWTSGIFDDGIIPMRLLTLSVTKASPRTTTIPVQFRRNRITLSASFTISIIQE